LRAGLLQLPSESVESRQDGHGGGVAWQRAGR